MNYLEELVENPTAVDIRFLKLYQEADTKRTNKWIKTNDQDLTSANIRRLKELVAFNLSKTFKRTSSYTTNR